MCTGIPAHSGGSASKGSDKGGRAAAGDSDLAPAAENGYTLYCHINLGQSRFLSEADSCCPSLQSSAAPTQSMQSTRGEQKTVRVYNVPSRKRVITEQNLMGPPLNAQNPAEQCPFSFYMSSILTGRAAPSGGSIGYSQSSRLAAIFSLAEEVEPLASRRTYLGALG